MNNDKDNATLYAELKAERFMTDQISLLHEAEDLAVSILCSNRSENLQTPTVLMYLKPVKIILLPILMSGAPQESPRRSYGSSYSCCRG